MNKDHWEREGNFFTGDGISECIEERSIKEYSFIANGITMEIGLVYKRAMGGVMQKINNSYNVVASDWSLRRVISSTMTILHHISNNGVFIPRLVKGTLLPPTTTEAVPKFDSEKFRNREKAQKMMKGMIAAGNITTTTTQQLPDLSTEDGREIKTFAGQYGYLLFQQQQQQQPTLATPIKTTTTTTTSPTVAPKFPPKTNNRKRLATTRLDDEKEEIKKTKEGEVEAVFDFDKMKF